MPDPKPQPGSASTPEERVKKVRALGGIAQSAALREGLLAATACGEDAHAAPYAWALLELATQPAIAPSGPAWSPFRAIAERRARVSSAAMSAVAAAWTALPPDAQAASRGVGKDRWDYACRAALRDPRAAIRRSAARAVAEVGDASLAGLAGELLLDADPDVARCGELALVGMVVRARWGAWSGPEREAWQKAAGEPLWAGVVSTDGLRWSAREERALTQSLGQALQSFAVHRPRGALLAALLIADRAFAREQANTPVMEAIGSREHPAHGPLTSLLRARAIPTGRLRALEWLHLPGARRAAIARLSRADGVFDHELVLAAAHLCMRPARRGALASVKAAGRNVPRATAEAPMGSSTMAVRAELAPDAALPGNATVAHLSPSARRLAPLWARSVGATSPQLHTALEPLLADEDPLVRMACVRHGVSSLRIDQVLDLDERVSRTAYLAWAADQEARRGPGPSKEDAARRAEHSRLLALFSRLPHPSVRAQAAIDRAFDADVFSPALPCPSVAGVAAAYRKFVENRAAFIDDLSMRLADPSQAGGGWSRVMYIARRLGVAHEIEHRLREVAAREGAGADLVRNVAQAVTVLGDVPTPTSRDALLRAMAHADSRVRANAVESLAKHARVLAASGSQTEPPPPQPVIWKALVELKTDGHHRVRANAARANLLADIASAPARREDTVVEVKPGNVEVGVETLASMLGDDRTMHRLAGAWLAWKVLPAGGPLRLHARWPEMVARVAEVSQFDAEPKVRARAARCTQLVEASLAAASMHAGGMLALNDGL
ncbi:MAG: hypothetical protein U0637_05245 [Phycisphaerales bacterium]